MCCSLPCLSFSLAPPPPTPTLFPYTTLFRATRWSPASRDGRSPAGRERDRAEQASGHLSGSDQRRRCRVGPDIQGPQAGRRCAADVIPSVTRSEERRVGRAGGLRSTGEGGG